MWWDLESIASAVGIEHGIGVDTQVSERIDGHQDVSDIGVDFAMLESLFQVLIDGFVGDLAEQCQIGYTDFFLLRYLECRLLDLRLSAIGPVRPPSTEQRGFPRAGGLLSTFRLTLSM